MKAELGEETGLVEEDLVAVLGMETVGDIIAIIEEKVCVVFICGKRLLVGFRQIPFSIGCLQRLFYLSWLELQIKHSSFSQFYAPVFSSPHPSCPLVSTPPPRSMTLWRP